MARWRFLAEEVRPYIPSCIGFLDMSQINPVVKSSLFMVLAWLLWSLDPILIRVIGDDVSRSVLVACSLLIGGLLMVGYAFKGYCNLLKRKDLWISFAYYIIFATIIADILYAIAVKNLNPGIVSLIMRSQVVMAILAAWFCFGEKPTIITHLGILVVVLGYAGNAYFSFVDSTDAARNPVVGWSCAIGAAVLWTSGTIMGKKLMENLNSTQLCGMRMLTAGILTAVGYLVCSGTGGFEALTGRQWAIIALKAALCSGLAYAVYMYGLHLAPVTAAAAIEQTAPLYTLCIATFWLHETIHCYQWICIAVVFCGAIIILAEQYRKSKRVTKTGKN